MRKCASGGQSLANAEQGVGMSGIVGKIDTEFFITNVLFCIIIGNPSSNILVAHFRMKFPNINQRLLIASWPAFSTSHLSAFANRFAELQLAFQRRQVGLCRKNCYPSQPYATPSTHILYSLARSGSQQKGGFAFRTGHAV